MNIKKQTSTVNTSSRISTIKYIVIHYTAGSTSKKGSAVATAKYFAKPKTGASADFIVDDEEIVQYNPDIKRRYCWSVGSSKLNKSKAGGKLWRKCTNANSISIEICSNLKKGYVYSTTQANSDGWYFTDKAVNNAIELTKYLMKEYNIPVSNVIRHYDVTGKKCPGIVGWNEDTNNIEEWNKFKTNINK